MTEDRPDSANGAADSPEGVFGNLPSTRPGSRSPRRRSTEAKETAAETSSQGSDPSTDDTDVAEEMPRGADPITPEPEPEPPQPSADPLAPQPGIQSVEDLAWAGVAVAAQAATAGIRFTSKALEAARKSIDRP